jgi:hypothetical protein
MNQPNDALKALEALEPSRTIAELLPHRKTLTVQDVAEKTGEMLCSLAVPHARAAKSAFDSFVLNLTIGRPTTDLTAAQALLLRSLSNPNTDAVTDLILDNLALPHGMTYAEAIARLTDRTGKA